MIKVFNKSKIPNAIKMLNWLKEKDIYTKYIDELKHNLDNDFTNYVNVKNFLINLESICKCKVFTPFQSTYIGFLWHKSIYGYEFWENISEKYRKEIFNH